MARVLRSLARGWRQYTTHAHPGVPSATPRVANKMIDLYKFRSIKFAEVEPVITSNKVIEKKPSKLARMQIRGCVLEATIAKEARMSKDDLLITSSIKEDGHPQPFYLLISNIALPSTTEEEVKMWFPKGVKLSIKHPYAAQLPTGKIVIEVKNPLFIDYIGAELPDGCNSVQDVYEEANRALQRKDFIRAANLYTRCLEDDGFPDRVGALYYRAEAWYGAGYHETGYHDVGSVLHVDKYHAWGNLLGGKLSFAMGGYRMAMECLRELDPEGSLTKRCATLLEQRDRCDYDFTDYYLNNAISEVSDYFGPLTFRDTADKGHGVFATENVTAGSLLVVWNATVVAPHSSELQTRLFQTFLRSRKALWQVMALFNPDMLPEIDIFQPGYIHEHDPEAVVWYDIFPIIEKFCTQNAFKTSNRKNPKETALWTLPALFNHSCVPNVTHEIMGTVVVLRAARDIRAGEELCVPYLDVKAPVHTRRSIIRKGWDFFCTCERCVVEGDFVRDRSDVALLVQEMEVAVEGLSGRAPQEAMYKLSRISCDVEKAIQAMGSERHRNWVRTSFYAAYSVYIQNERLFRSSMELPALKPLKMMQALHSTSPGFGVIKEMICLASVDPFEDYDEVRELVLREATAFYGTHIQQEARDRLIRGIVEELGLEFQF